MIRLVRSTLMMCLLMSWLPVSAHPAGSMIALNGELAWSYVCPIHAIEHTACVMIWSESNGVSTWIRSERPASDWFLSKTEDGRILLVESAFDMHQQAHEYRLLEAEEIGGKVTELTPWQTDTHRFGMAGFAELERGSYVFVSYPHIWLKQGSNPPIRWLQHHADAELFGIRALPSGQLLIRGDHQIWRLDRQGNILEQWDDLKQDTLSEVPMMGNILFDATYNNAQLSVAYWGGRQWITVAEGARRILHQFSPPYIPHLVANDSNAQFILASSLDPGHAEGIRPQLLRWQENQITILWP